MKPLRVFISSPEDVRTERGILRKALARLDALLRDRVQVESIFWEDRMYRATSSFQEQIVRPAQTDIVICILWLRFGTPLPDSYRRQDGTTFQSGTEFEFEDALLGFQARGSPEILVYRKTAEPSYTPRDLEQAEVLLTQRRALEGFMERWFRSGETFTAAFNTFATADEFEEKVERHVREVIERRLSDGRTQQDECRPWWDGSPFRGLQVFEREHSPVFFGRTRAAAEIVQRIRERAAQGTAFLLVIGMSGCGKSSLLRAGALPLLTEQGVIEGVGMWRWAVMTSGDTLDPFAWLASALVCDPALPELTADGTSAAGVAELLRSGTAAAVGLLKGALSQAAAGVKLSEALPQQPLARLALVLDPLEEILSARLDRDQVRAFAAVIEALAKSGLVWVLASMRSDAYPRLQDFPVLLALKEGAGQIDLLPPSPEELAQVIRLPATAAGLHYERHPTSGACLDDALRDAVVDDPEALPLLEFTLEELYRRKRDSILTWDAYEELGGVEGALARRAEEVFAALGREEQEAFSELMRSLVDFGPIGPKDRPTRRRTALAQPRGGESRGRRGLIEALLTARLLVADRGPGDAPVIALAHEALLRKWPRLAAWLESDQELLRARARVTAAAGRWRAEGCRHDLLLPDGKALAEARGLIGVGGLDLEESTQRFVQASVARARRQVRVRRGMIGALIVLSISSALLAIHARRQSSAASGNAERLRQRSIELLVERGRTQWLDGERDGALHTLMEAKELGADDSAHGYLLQRAQAAAPRQIATLPAASLARMSPDGSRLVTFDNEGRGTVYDGENGSRRMTLEGHWTRVLDAAFDAGGGLLASCSQEGPILVWELDTGAFHRVMETTLTPAVRIEWVKDAILAQGRFEAEVWSASTGAPLWGSHFGSSMAEAFLSPDGGVLIRQPEASEYTPDGGLLIRQPAALEFIGELHPLAGPERIIPLTHPLPPNLQPLPDSDGLGALTRGSAYWLPWRGDLSEPISYADDGSGDSGSHVTAAVSIPSVGMIYGTEDGRCVCIASRSPHQVCWQVPAHQAPVVHLAASPDGESFVSASTDRTAKVWNASNGALVASLDHAGPVSWAALGGDRVVIWGEGRAVLWALPPTEVGTDVGRSTYPFAFSPDGSMFLDTWGGGQSLLETASGKILHRLEGASKRRYSNNGQFGPAGSVVAIKDLGVWDVATGALRMELQESSAISVSAGDRFLAEVRDSELVIHDLGSRIEVLRAEARNLRRMAFLGNGDHFVIQDGSGFVPERFRCWSLTDSRLVLERHEPAVFFHPREAQILVFAADQVMALEVHDGRVVSSLPAPGDFDSYGGFTWSPDGSRLVISRETSEAYHLELRNGMTGELVSSLIELKKPDPEQTYKFDPIPVFSSDGAALAMYRPGEVIIANASTGAIQSRFRVSSAPQTLALSAARGLLVTAGRDDLRVRTIDGRLLDVIQLASASLLRFTDDGHLLAAGSEGWRYLSLRFELPAGSTALTAPDDGAAIEGAANSPAPSTEDPARRRARLEELYARPSENDPPAKRLHARHALELALLLPDSSRSEQLVEKYFDWLNDDAQETFSTLRGLLSFPNRRLVLHALAEWIADKDLEGSADEERVMEPMDPAVAMDALTWESALLQLASYEHERGNSPRGEKLDRARLRLMERLAKRHPTIIALRRLRTAHEDLKDQSWWQQEHGPAELSELQARIDEREASARKVR